MDYKFYPRFLANAIEQEIAGTAYKFEGNDRDVLAQMCDEINQTFPDYSVEIHYLTQIDISYTPAGISPILLKYIYQFMVQLMLKKFYM